MGNSASYKEQENALKVESPALIQLLEQQSGSNTIPLGDVFWDVLVDTLDKLAQAVPNANQSTLLDHVASNFITNFSINKNLTLLVAQYCCCQTHSTAFCCKLPSGKVGGAREYSHFISLLHSIVSHIISYIVSHTNHTTAAKILMLPVTEDLLGETTNNVITDRAELVGLQPSLCLLDTRTTFPEIVEEYKTRGLFALLCDRLLDSIIVTCDIYAAYVACLDHDTLGVTCSCSGEYIHYCVQAALAEARDKHGKAYSITPPVTLQIPKPHRLAAWLHKLCTTVLAILSCTAYDPPARPLYVLHQLDSSKIYRVITQLLRVVAPAPDNSTPRGSQYDFAQKDLRVPITSTCHQHQHQTPNASITKLVADATSVYVFVAAESVHKPLLHSALFYDTEWATALDPVNVGTTLIELILTLKPELMRHAQGIDMEPLDDKVQVPAHLLALKQHPDKAHLNITHPVFLYNMLQFDPLCVLVTSNGVGFSDVILILISHAEYYKIHTLVQCATLQLQNPQDTFDLHSNLHENGSSIGSFLLLSMFSTVQSNQHTFPPETMEIYLHFICLLTQNAVEIENSFQAKVFITIKQCFLRLGTFFTQHTGELEKATMLQAKYVNASISGSVSKPIIAKSNYDLDTMVHVSLTLECCIHIITTLLTPRLVNANLNILTWLSLCYADFIDFTTKLGSWTRQLRLCEAQAFLLSKRFPEKTVVVTTEDGIVEIPSKYSGEQKSSECVLPIRATRLPSFAKGLSRLMPLILFIKNCVSKKTDGTPADVHYLSAHLQPLHTRLRELGYDSSQFQYQKILNNHNTDGKSNGTPLKKPLLPMESETALRIRQLPLQNTVPYETIKRLHEGLVWSTVKQQKWVTLNITALQHHIQQALQDHS